MSTCQGISDIITIPGQINVDFADVRAIMSSAGPALMGIGYGVGEQRALQAAQGATSSPLLEQTIDGATGILVNITSSSDLTLVEVDTAMTYIMEHCDAKDANIIFGTVQDETMEGTVRITVLATGFDGYAPAVVEPKMVNAVVQEPAALAQPTQAAGVSVAQRNNEFLNLMKDRGAARSTPVVDPSTVFDETDLDVPAFIREHRQATTTSSN